MIKKWSKVKRYRIRLYEKRIKSNFIKSANTFVKTWINLEGIMLSEITQRERQILYDLTYMWNHGL